MGEIDDDMHYHGFIFNFDIWRTSQSHHPIQGTFTRRPTLPIPFPHVHEGLYRLINEAASNRDIRGVSICHNGPKLTHLLFANDILIFCRARESECQTLFNILAKYERAFGQQINRAKTTLLLANPPMLICKIGSKICLD